MRSPSDGEAETGEIGIKRQRPNITAAFSLCQTPSTPHGSLLSLPSVAKQRRRELIREVLEIDKSQTHHQPPGQRLEVSRWFGSFPSQVFPLPTLKAEDERSAGGPEEPVRAPPTALAVGWLAFAQVLGQKGKRGRAARLATVTTRAGGLKVFKVVIVKIPPLFSPAGGRC